MNIQTYAANIPGSTETEIIEALKTRVQLHTARGLEGFTVRLDNWLFAGQIKEVEWDGLTAAIEIESVAAGQIFLEIAEFKITGRSLWSSARKRDGIDGPALRFQVKVTTDEGETFETLSGWLL